MIVEAKVALERALELLPPGEVAASELDPPVLVEDGPLKALHEAVGEGVARLGPGVPDPEAAAGRVEGALELAAAVREGAFHAPASPLEVVDNLVEEASGHLGARVAEEELRERIGGRRVAGGDLPDAAYALEIADVEAVEADQLAVKWRPASRH